MNIAKMSEEQLQTELKKLAKMTKAMGPMLFHLREKMKAQGRKGEGWGHWVKANLPITLRTADTWASDWGRANGKQVPETSGKISKGKQANVIPFKLERPEWFTKAEEEAFHQAIEIVGDLKAFQIMYEAVIKASDVA